MRGTEFFQHCSVVGSLYVRKRCHLVKNVTTGFLKRHAVLANQSQKLAFNRKISFFCDWLTIWPLCRPYMGGDTTSLTRILQGFPLVRSIRGQRGEIIKRGGGVLERTESLNLNYHSMGNFQSIPLKPLLSRGDNILGLREERRKISHPDWQLTGHG